jgi:oligopeptide transport system substrate-binding protein
MALPKIPLSKKFFFGAECQPSVSSQVVIGMHLHKNTNNSEEQLLGNEEILREGVLRALERFPRFCDDRLQKGLSRVTANTSTRFLVERSFLHLKRLLLAQFFLQKKIEHSLENGTRDEAHLFLRIFPVAPYRMCIALVHFSPQEEDCFSFAQIARELGSFVPGFEKIDHSFYSWWEPELFYHFYYFEIQKIRGKFPEQKELCSIEKLFCKKLISLSVTPSIFYPCNIEEAYRQLLVLKKEISHAKDLPQASLHFQGKSHSHLEFLIYLVCPPKKSFFPGNNTRLPSNVQTITHFQQEGKDAFSIVFSIRIPLDQFLEGNEINLIHARRTASRYLEDLGGHFRDYNGGLFEVQQTHFDQIKAVLSEKIPSFSLFAERLFYSIIPIEKQLSMSLEVVESLFSLVAKAIEHKQEIKITEQNISIFKVKKPLFDVKNEDVFASAYFELSNFHYYCSINESKKTSQRFREKPIQVLRLNFLEGPPISLNPRYVYNEIRCRSLTKALYEGLTRLGLHGTPCLSGAESVEQSSDGLTYLFKIRNQCWSNGEKVSAFHYERSWKQALLAQDVPSEPFFILKNAQKIKEKKASIELLGVNAIDERTLHVELERRDYYFLEKVAHPLFFPLLIPSQEPKYFNGPYLLFSKNSQELILERNPYYWDRENIFFNQIQIEWGKTNQEVYQAFLDKTTDWVGTPFSRFSNLELHALRAKGALKEKIVARALWIYFNTNHLLFASSVIRHAFHAALDHAFISDSIFPNDLLLKSPLPMNISACAFEFKKETAAHLKEIFKKELKKLGVDQKDLAPIHFSYYPTPGHAQLVHYLKARWEEVFDISIVLEGLPWNTLCSQLMRGNFDLAECTESAFSQDPIELLQRFEHKNSPYNYTGWSDSTFQNKMAAIRSSQSLAEREQFLRQAEECLYQGLPFIPIVNRKFMYSTSSSLIDYVIDETGCVDFRWAKLRG